MALTPWQAQNLSALKEPSTWILLLQYFQSQLLYHAECVFNSCVLYMIPRMCSNAGICSLEGDRRPEDCNHRITFAVYSSNLHAVQSTAATEYN